MKAADRNRELAALATELLNVMDHYRQFEKTTAAKDIFDRMVRIAEGIRHRRSCEC
jgi:hypothetical protein